MDLLTNELASQALSRVVETTVKRKQQEAWKSIEHELRSAGLAPEDVAGRDDFAAMILKISSAVLEGAAVRNLRLLAKILVGELKRPVLGIERFALWTDFIRSLLPEEAVLLVALLRAEKDADGAGNRFAPDKKFALIQAWVRRELVGSDKIFSNRDELNQTGLSLQRTGFVLSEILDGDGVGFELSPRGKELFDLVEYDDWANAALDDVHSAPNK